MAKINSRPIGELTLTLAGCVSIMRDCKANKYWKGYFEQKVRFNRELKPYYLAIDWDRAQILLDVKQAYIAKGERAIKEGDLL